MIKRANIVWDNERHPAVNQGMTNHIGESDAAYLRKCVEFYETNKDNPDSRVVILERLSDRLLAIETMLKQGITVVQKPALPDNDNDDLFDEILEQIE